MIYTTYFAKLHSLPDDVIPIAICGKSPEWYKGLQYKKLAPKYDFFMKWKQNHDNDYYLKCFDEQVLSPLTIEGVLSDLRKLTGQQNLNIALVCYEKPENFCHRHRVAKWFLDHSVECIEWIEP